MVGRPLAPDVVADHLIDWIRFTPFHPNQAPILDPIGARSVADGTPLRISVKGSDLDDDALTYSTSSGE